MGTMVHIYVNYCFLTKGDWTGIHVHEKNEQIHSCTQKDTEIHNVSGSNLTRFKDFPALF